MEKQYFYLVIESNEDTDSVPKKITLQKSEAIKYGRGLATKNSKDILNEVTKRELFYHLYSQPITRTGELTRICELKPYRSE